MVLIKELLPNPVGHDAGGEWIKLFNDGGYPVNLSGWQIKDLSGKNLNLKGDINPRSDLTIRLSKTKLTLNNDKDTALLYDASGKLVDKLSYSSSYEGGVVTAEHFINNPVNNYVAASSKAPDKNLIIPDAYDLSPLFVGIFLAALVGVASTVIIRK